MFDIVIRTLLFLLAAGGIFLCSTWFVPQLKRFLTDECALLVQDPPFPKLRYISQYLGIAFYILMIIAALTTWEWAVLAGFLTAVLAMFASAYLLIILIMKKHSRCLFCYFIHTVNFCIFLIWLLIASRA